MNSCGMDVDRINKERSCCSITRILKVLSTFPSFVTYMHIASPESHAYIVCSVETEWKGQIFAKLSRRKFNGKTVFCLFCYDFVLVLILLNFFSDFK